MNVPKYVRKRMSIRERFKFWYLRNKSLRMMKKMAYHILHGNHKKACDYEDLMYKYDNTFSEFANKMFIKYA